MSGEGEDFSEILHAKKDGKTAVEYAKEKDSFDATLCLLDAELKLAKVRSRHGKLGGVNTMKGKSSGINTGRESDGIGNKEGSQRTPGDEEDEIGFKVSGK